MTTTSKETPGNVLATEAINEYLQYCSQFNDSPCNMVPYEIVERATRDTKTGHGWTEDLYNKTLMTRWNDQIPEDIMLSTTVTHLVTADEVVCINKGVLHTNAKQTTPPIDVLREINDFHATNQSLTAEKVKGLLCNFQGTTTNTTSNTTNNSVENHTCTASTTSSSGSTTSNIFDSTSYCSAKIQCVSSNGPGSIDTSNLISGELSNWLIENAPVIDSPEELCFYGFKKIKNDESFFVDSPIGYWPVIPVYVGTEYSNRIRGGLYIEHHNPIHMWSPTSVSAATSGFILTMIPISPVSLGWDGGWRGTNPLPPAFGDYKVAKIHIQFGETLISHPFAFHCDGTLGGGVYLTSFSFGRGPEGDKSVDSAASGFQPIVL